MFGRMRVVLKKKRPIEWARRKKGFCPVVGRKRQSPGAGVKKQLGVIWKRKKTANSMSEGKVLISKSCGKGRDEKAEAARKELREEAKLLKEWWRSWGRRAVGNLCEQRKESKIQQDKVGYQL